MSTDITASRVAAFRGPDERFKSANSANEKLSALKKIDVSSFQLDESYEENSDPYNSTGRFMVSTAQTRNRK
jgi:hypothetical protein